MAESAEVRELSQATRDLKHQLESIGGRAERLEKFREQIEANMWFVTSARAILSIFAGTVVVGIVTFAYWLGSLSSDVKHHAETHAEAR
jgi:hypothetical protein